MGEQLLAASVDVHLLFPPAPQHSEFLSLVVWHVAAGHSCCVTYGSVDRLIIMHPSRSHLHLMVCHVDCNLMLEFCPLQRPAPVTADSRTGSFDIGTHTPADAVLLLQAPHSCLAAAALLGTCLLMAPAWLRWMCSRRRSTPVQWALALARRGSACTACCSDA